MRCRSSDSCPGPGIVKKSKNQLSTGTDTKHDYFFARLAGETFYETIASRIYGAKRPKGIFCSDLILEALAAVFYSQSHWH